MKLPLLIASCFTLATGAIAQTNGSNSPYSRYGFGLLDNRPGAVATATSGTAIGFRNSHEINTMNPASYSAIDSLSLLFDAGYTFQNGNFISNGHKLNARNSSLDYVNAGFRLAPNLGLAIGLNPYSTIGYSFTEKQHYEMPTGEIFENTTYHGNGGLHSAFLGLGWQPLKGLSLGVNAGYLWGDMTNTVTISFSDPNINTRRREYYAHPKTYKLDFGIQYQQSLSKNDNFVLGLTYGLGHKINSPATFYDQRIQKLTYVGDTIQVNDAFELPHTFGVGLSWNHKERLRLAFDYQLQKWADIQYPVLENTKNGYQYIAKKNQFNNLQRFSLGTEFIPDPNSLNKMRRIRYRFGAAYTTPYIKVNGEEGPKSYQVSAGIGIPIINYHGQATNRCIFNFGVSFQHLSPKFSTGIKENYIRLHIGLTFNERWFSKWKAM